MIEDEWMPDFEDKAVEFIRTELAKAAPTRRRRMIEKFILAALGSIPWVGGFISAAASYKAEEGSVRTDSLQTQWLDEHARKIADLMTALREIVERLENLGPEIEDRIQSEAYLAVVRRSFRTWDRADSEEKRNYVKNLVSNAAGTQLTSDDVIRLFVDWLDLYHEAHFAVIREIYKNPGSSRFLIWDAIHGELPRRLCRGRSVQTPGPRLKHWRSHTPRTGHQPVWPVSPTQTAEA